MKLVLMEARAVAQDRQPEAKNISHWLSASYRKGQNGRWWLQILPNADSIQCFGVQVAPESGPAHRVCPNGALIWGKADPWWSRWRWIGQRCSQAIWDAQWSQTGVQFLYIWKCHNRISSHILKECFKMQKKKPADAAA
jgi:hypothetical protein